MSAIFKGKQGIVMVANEPFFDAATGVRGFHRTWVGSQSAIFGFGTDLEADNFDYSTANLGGPVYSLTARVIGNDPVTEDLDRYEITTESQEISLFQHPDIVSAAETYDASIAAGAPTFRQAAEDAVVEKPAIAPTGTLASVIRHLKNGVTGKQLDSLVLRRFRRIDLSYAAGAGKFNLDDSSYYYSTAQLNLPGTVAFTLPPTPASGTDYEWGWRRRGQHVEIIGMYAEQSIELMFAPWSTLLYTAAAGNLNW